jgi:FtsP/CotA-like multicopper oxidase with cupredoxin domain
MDGAANVSGPPVPPGRVFVYEFPIRQSGTYWYHSHFELQEQRGLAGPFVIEARREPGRYDHDAVVMLTDWMHGDPRAVVPRLRAASGPGAAVAMPARSASGAMAKTMPAAGGMAMPAGKPEAAAMQMGGGADLSDVKYDAFLLNGRGTQAPWTLAVRAGERVRLRLINAGASTYFSVMLDGHPLEVTHADGQPVRPVVVDRILMGMAECCDVVVRLKRSGSYTLHAVAQDGSGQAVGVLHTRDAKPSANLALPAPGARALAYADLKSPEETTLPAGDLHEFRLALQGDMRRYVWTVNGQAYPDADPLLIRQGERVRVELVNETPMWHPMHLHGHFFRLLNDAGPFCPLKHTINVAPRSSERFEFTADNPGRWFFHCHNLYHLEAGMARVWEYAA